MIKLTKRKPVGWKIHEVLKYLWSKRDMGVIEEVVFINGIGKYKGSEAEITIYGVAP